jgi:hypothetical protein
MQSISSAITGGLRECEPDAATSDMARPVLAPLVLRWLFCS